jgi:hypothetical protein
MGQRRPANLNGKSSGKFGTAEIVAVQNRNMRIFDNS